MAQNTDSNSIFFLGEKTFSSGASITSDMRVACLTGTMSMRQMLLYFGVVFVLCFMLSACGVKSIGDDVTPHTPSGLRTSAYSPTDARYPVTGNRIEARLYMLNHPTTVMARQNYVQATIREQYNKAHGIQSSPATPFTRPMNSQILDPMGFTTELPEQQNSVSPFR